MSDNTKEDEGEVIEGEIVGEEKDRHRDLIICAPHPDDEIIGTYKYLTDKQYTPIIIYSGELDAKRRESALKLREHVDIKVQLFQMTIPQPLLVMENLYLMPDPVYELHPLHRQWGMVGETMARVGFDVIFYSTNMNAPYIHELAVADDKKELLNKVYPDQKSLWEYDHKYFLFEGYNKWIF